jgi:DNA polymerase-1
MKILLDSDMLLFRTTSATEVEVELDDEVWVRHSELPQAREMYWETCQAWCELLGCSLDDVLHCFTDKSNFRKDVVDPNYKANRKSKPKPIGYRALKNQLLEESGAWLHRMIEADDLIGIFATMPEMEAEGMVIASGDKDLMQLAGKHIWFRSEKDPEPEDGLHISCDDSWVMKTNTKEHAQRFTYQQYLTGDATDGVPGCPGVGAVNAKRIVDGFDLSDPVGCWEAIVRTYEAAQRKKNLALYDAHEYATQQARLVRILRNGEYDFMTHEVQLWNPPTP